MYTNCDLGRFKMSQAGEVRLLQYLAGLRPATGAATPIKQLDFVAGRRGIVRHCPATSSAFRRRPPSSAALPSGALVGPVSPRPAAGGWLPHYKLLREVYIPPPNSSKLKTFPANRNFCVRVILAGDQTRAHFYTSAFADR